MATGPVVDKLATDYAAAGSPVLFLEQPVDSPLGSRYNRWWSAHSSGGSVTLPLVMLSSGHQISNGYLGQGAYDTYHAMVDAELARPAGAALVATSARVGNRLRFTVTLTNLSGVTLSPANGATVHALVYEQHTPVSTSTDHITGRIVRAAVAQPLTTSLAQGASATFTLETEELSTVVNWAMVRTVALADYRPAGSSAYDMLQAASADSRPALQVSLTVTPRQAQPGAQVAYALRVVNTGNVELHADITNTLPSQVTSADPQAWQAVIAAGETWERSIAATVQPGATGPLVGRLTVTTAEGAEGEAVTVVNGTDVFLPLSVR